MQLSATVEGVDITDRRPTRTVRAVDLRSNDREYSLEADPRESLSDVLRERLHLTSTKKGARGIEGLRELRRASRWRSRTPSTMPPDDGDAKC